MKIFFTLLWITYSLFEGIREGFYFHNRANSARQDNFEIHPLFFIQRSIVLILIFVPINIQFGMYNSLLFILVQIFTFSFFHDGIYYVTRNNLDKKLYAKRWFDSSKTSTARIELSFILRLLFLIAGLILLYFNILKS